jgi:hypothetical protein
MLPETERQDFMDSIRTAFQAIGKKQKSKSKV